MRLNSALAERKYSRRTGTFSKRPSARTLVPSAPRPARLQRYPRHGRERARRPRSSLDARRSPYARRRRLTPILRLEIQAFRSIPTRRRSAACWSCDGAAQAQILGCDAGAIVGYFDHVETAALNPTVTRPAPASKAFSTSSLTTDAGRSMISPAAIWPIVTASSSRIWALAMVRGDPTSVPARFGVDKGQGGSILG